MSPIQPFTITRAIDASPQRVFEAWTRPDQAGWWLDPDGEWSAPPELISMELRPGGTWRMTFVDDAGTEYPAAFVYQDVVDGERLAFTTGTLAETDAVATVTFTDRDGATEQTFRSHAAAAQARELHRGWSQMFDRLAAQVAR